MPTIEVNDETKRIFEKFKTKYEKKYGKITWKDFMELIAYDIKEPAWTYRSNIFRRHKSIYKE